MKSILVAAMMAATCIAGAGSGQVQAQDADFISVPTDLTVVGTAQAQAAISGWIVPAVPLYCSEEQLLLPGGCSYGAPAYMCMEGDQLRSQLQEYGLEHLLEQLPTCEDPLPPFQDRQEDPTPIPWPGCDENPPQWPCPPLE